MNRPSESSLTPLSPDELPDLPDIDDHSEEDSESSIRAAAAVTSSYSEICLSAEDDLNDDLLPGEIQDLNLVQAATEKITKLVEEINQGEQPLEFVRETKTEQNPTELGVKNSKIFLDTSEADTAKVAGEEPAGEASEEFRCERPNHNVDNIDDKCKTTSLAATPGISCLPSILADLEADARRLANSVQHMMETLSTQLRNVTHLTAECMDAHKIGVTRVCDAADSNVKSMYRLLAKYEELSNAMKPVYKTARELKHVKHVLTQFEALVEGKGGQQFDLT